MPVIEDILFNIKDAALQGGGVLRSFFGKNVIAERKTSEADIFSIADTESEKMILNVLKKHYPDATYHAEESGIQSGSSDLEFVIDPLDGSHNYLLGIPYFCVAIGCKYKDEFIAAIAYNPITNDLFECQKNKGLKRNGEDVVTSRTTHISQAVCSLILSYQTSIEDTSAYHQKLIKSGTKRLLSNWSPVLDFCLLGSGKIDLIYCNVADENEMYDFPIGLFLASEAGAQIKNLDNHLPCRNFVCSNNYLLDAIEFRE